MQIANQGTGMVPYVKAVQVDFKSTCSKVTFQF